MIISINTTENIITFTTENISRNFPYNIGKIIDIVALRDNTSYAILYSPVYLSA